MKSKEYEAARGLASLRSEVSEVELEGHPKGEPMYLPPKLLGESDSVGAKIYATDTY
jgi:hypothetical protein